MPTHAGHHGRTAFVQDDAEAARTQWRQVRPIKVLGIEHGVNITVGLPVVRTSVDHGTAFDIAGTGCADERSLLEAIRQAVELAHRRS